MASAVCRPPTKALCNLERPVEARVELVTTVNAEGGN
jgi:hypothetical protein